MRNEHFRPIQFARGSSEGLYDFTLREFIRSSEDRILQTQLRFLHECDNNYQDRLCNQFYLSEQIYRVNHAYHLPVSLEDKTIDSIWYENQGKPLNLLIVNFSDSYRNTFNPEIPYQIRKETKQTYWDHLNCQSKLTPIIRINEKGIHQPPDWFYLFYVDFS